MAVNARTTKAVRPHHGRAVAALKRSDERLAEVIASIGPYRPTLHGEGFQPLVRAIVSQQVSKYAAEAILGRLHALFADGVPTAEAMLALSPRRLQGVGLSRRKVEYLHDLAKHVAAGHLDFAALADLPDDVVIERLTAVKGIGRWTAEMYLLFTLGRPDVLPLGDAALVNAVRDIYGLPPEADAAHFGAIAEAWRPWRGIACWYLYRSINAQRAAAAAAKAAARRKP
jgi:DNA-3-methyladenine glycosylase II